MAKSHTKSLEDTFAHLETLISKMDDKGASLEDSLRAFEEGVKLTSEAQQTLLEAEQRVQLLVDKDNSLAAEPFNDENVK
ncbi:MAG: exodeoxyribonuclease VII small subunit [Halioglobus sp.]|jgi:exodeoxyribonuclease VII small subunit